MTTAEKGAAIGTKKDAGANYGMAQYGQDLNGDGTVKEWFEQADAFNAACIGKTASELSALAVETGYGATDLQTAGCTIHIGDMVKAAVKAATADNIQAKIDLVKHIGIVAASAINQGNTSIKGIRDNRRREQQRNHIDYVKESAANE